MMPTPTRFGSLNVSISPDRRTLGAVAAKFAARALNEACAMRGGARVVFACAPSQDQFLAVLVREPIDWSKVTIFHMDEYVGLPASDLRTFRSYLHEHLLAHIGPASAVQLLAPDDGAERECERYAALLQSAPLDLVCLGIGENGHLAFNDPPVADFEDPQTVKVVRLDGACRAQQVHDGCFPELASVPTHAITLTIPTLLSARRICGVVPGERKAAAVRDALLGPIATTCPASALRMHADATLHLDVASAAFLG